MGRDNFVAPTAPSGSRRPPIPDVLGAVLGDTGKPAQVAVGKINTTGGTQMRAGLDDATVFEYGQAMIAANGWATFPPVVCYHDGKDYWLADGFHRVAAFLESFPDPKREIPVEVRAGTRRDAVLHAAGANASHGLRRTNADKRRSVETLLRDEEWRQWSDGEIAKRCGVSQPFVSSVRRELATTQNRFESTARTGADGRTINTAKIGTRPAPEVQPAKPVYTPVTVAGNSEPTLGTPIPPRADNKREYATVDDLIEEVKTCVKPHYTGTGLTRFQIADDMRQNSNTRSGDFWGFVCRQTANFRPLDMTLAISQAAYQVSIWGIDGFDPAVAHADETAGGAPTIVTLDELPVIASVTAPWAGPVADPDEEITHPLDGYDDANPYVGKMGQLYDLKTWLKVTRDEKAREFFKLTGQPAPAALGNILDHMIGALEAAMDVVEQEAVADAAK